MAEKIKGWTISSRTDSSGKKIYQAVKKGLIGFANEDESRVLAWVKRQKDE